MCIYWYNTICLHQASILGMTLFFHSVEQGSSILPLRQGSHSCWPLLKKRFQSLCRRTKSTNICLICQHHVCQKIFPNSWAKNHKTGSRIFKNPQLEFVPADDSISASCYKWKEEKLLSQLAIPNIFKAYWVLLDRWNVCDLVKQLHNINTSTALF